jgi:site-specific DNA-methyltransferase (adenine-specific)
MEWNRFLNADCFDVMSEIEDNSVDFIFTSPPDISQGDFDNEIESYKSFQRKALSECSRITKDDGFVLVSQTDRKINGEILPNHITYYQTMIDLGWKLKDYKLMVRNYPVDKRDMYTFNYQHTLIFTKKGTIKRSGDFLKNIMVYDTKKLPESKLHIWNETFVELMINYLSKENEKVFDPFAGSGVVPYVAKRLNRQYLGCELNEDIFNESLMSQKNNPLEEFMG